MIGSQDSQFKVEAFHRFARLVSVVTWNLLLQNHYINPISI